MSVPAPDPFGVRAASVEQLRRLDLPTPPPNYPLAWQPGDTVDLRPVAELEERVAILNVVLARCFGMPGEAAMGWLLDAHLLESLSKPEWSFVATGEGDHLSFALHLEALYALAWLLGLVAHLDPKEPAPEGLVSHLPHLPSKENFAAWRARTSRTPRSPAEAAVVLDLLRCLDWAHLEAKRRRIRPVGLIDSNVIAQRRWALAWAVILRGPNQPPPPGWEEVDLSI